MNHHKHTSRYGSISLSLSLERERHLHLLKITPTTVCGCSLDLPPQMDTPDCAIRRLVGEFIQGRSLQDGQTWPGGTKWFCRLPEVFRSWFFWSARRPFWWGCLFWVLLVVIHNESVLSERITWKGGRKEKTATLTDSDAVATHWQTQCCCLCWWWCGCCCLLVVVADGGLIPDSPKIVVQFFKHFFRLRRSDIWDADDFLSIFCGRWVDKSKLFLVSPADGLVFLSMSVDLCTFWPREPHFAIMPLPSKEMWPQPSNIWPQSKTSCETSLAYHGQVWHVQTSPPPPCLCTNSSAGTIFWP